MISQDSIQFLVHPPMEFLYALYAAGTEKHLYHMIESFELTPEAKLYQTIKDIEKDLSHFVKQELKYFYDLSGLGYIFYKFVVWNEDVTDVPVIIEKMKETDPVDLCFYILQSVCKNHLPPKDVPEYTALKQDVCKMLHLVTATPFQDEERKKRTIESLKNPEETKQRFSILLSQFYAKGYKKIEAELLHSLQTHKKKYEEDFYQDAQKFLGQYFNLCPSQLASQVRIHISFFKYVSWHHYELPGTCFPDWLILGVYCDQLFSDKKMIERLSLLFKTLSDPKRIEILLLLSERTWYGQELAEKLNITPATISYHMGFLQQLGLVTYTRADNRSYYAVDHTRLTGQLEEVIRVLCEK